MVNQRKKYKILTEPLTFKEKSFWNHWADSSANLEGLSGSVRLNNSSTQYNNKRKYFISQKLNKTCIMNRSCPLYPLAQGVHFRVRQNNLFDVEHHAICHQEKNQKDSVNTKLGSYQIIKSTYIYIGEQVQDLQHLLSICVN